MASARNSSSESSELKSEIKSELNFADSAGCDEDSEEAATLVA